MTGQRPHLAVVLPALAGGGAQRAAVTLVRLLHDRGWRIDLVLFRKEGPFLAEVPEGVTLVDLGGRRALHALPGLIRYLRRRRPPTVLAGMDRTIVVTVVAARLARVRTRVVGQVQNTMTEVAAASRGWQDRLRPVLARIFYPDHVIAVSEGVARDLVDNVGLREETVEVVHNPVAVEEVAASARTTPTHPWFSDGAPPVILGIGRLTRQKDFPTLVRAFRRVRERTPARLVILGEGEQRSLLEGLAVEEGVEDDVALPGFVDDPAPYLGHAAVFVLSSAWEGFGIVVVEALAAGTPVVATDCRSGPSEILDGGRHGRLVGVGDHEAMADAIVATLSEEPDATALLARARAFGAEALLPHYLRVLGLER